MDVATATYRLTAAFPSHERFGLTSQMRRAAVSVPSNIAEGSGRESKTDFRQFVLVERGSACELQTQLMLCIRLNYCQQPLADDLLRQVDEVGRMLNGLATFLKSDLQSRATSH